MPSGVLEAVELFFRRVPGFAELVTGRVPGITMLRASVVPSGVPRVPGLTDMPAIPVHGMVPLRGQLTSLGGGGVASGGRQGLLQSLELRPRVVGQGFEVRSRCVSTGLRVVAGGVLDATELVACRAFSVAELRPPRVPGVAEVLSDLAKRVQVHPADVLAYLAVLLSRCVGSCRLLVRGECGCGPGERRQRYGAGREVSGDVHVRVPKECVETP